MPLRGTPEDEKDAMGGHRGENGKREETRPFQTVVAKTPNIKVVQSA